MALKERLKIESTPIFVFLLFYIIAAIGNLYVLATNDFQMVQTALIAILSLITAYGLYRMEKWSLWLVVVLFFIGNTFGFVTLYFSIAGNGFAGSVDTLLLNLALIGYLIMTWLATVYIGARRDKLK
jgi:uncharacterized membrane protein (DUF2068 family)